MVLLIPLAMVLASANCYLAFYKGTDQPLRRSLLAAAISLFLFIAVSTEMLGGLNLVNSLSITTSWLVLDIALAAIWIRLQNLHGVSFASVAGEWLSHVRSFCGKLGYATVSMITTLLCITLVVAIVATPNNLDSLSYHLSRLGYWIQQGNVAHYASHIERAISFSPFSEYVHLHTFLLSGSERYCQLLQWLCLAGILITVSLLVERFSSDRLVLRVALCFAATLPIVVLESMTTQNDLVAAFFILGTAFYLFDYLYSKLPSNLYLIALCCGLGMMTKGTFAFYVLPFGIYFFFRTIGQPAFRKPLTGLVCGAALVTLMLNAPFWYRTYRVFDSPIGTISNGNKNNFNGPADYVSSVSKHVFLHLGFVSPGNRYNDFLEDALENLHDGMGISLDAPGTGMAFKMNKLNFNEDFAHNFSGIWLVLFSIPLLFLARLSKTARWYCALTFCSFLVFCFFISYQIYGSRLHIPFFLLMSPVIGLVYGSVLPAFAAKALTVLLWVSALPFALLSSAHPLLSTQWFFEKVFPPVNAALNLNIHIDSSNLNLKQPSILSATPGRILWGDHWPETQDFQNRVNALNPQQIGFDFTEASLDYAYQLMFRQEGRTFGHVLVDNPSKILEDPAFQPDVIIAEKDEGQAFDYHGKTYRLQWARGNKRIYVPLN